MKTSSCKAKGRRLQSWVAGKISSYLGIPFKKDGDIDVRPMGQSGCDIILRGKAKELFPYSIECKNQERVNVWKAWEQAVKNSGEGEKPLLFIGKNRHDALVIQRAEDWFEERKT